MVGTGFPEDNTHPGGVLEGSKGSAAVVYVYPIPKCFHKMTVDPVNHMGFQKICT